jgi:AP-2 complex subunit mu-1
VQITADFPDDKKAKNVVIKIPMPPTAATANSKASKGRARYEPGERALVWRISNFQGMQVSSFSAFWRAYSLCDIVKYANRKSITVLSQAAELRATVDLLPAVREKVWVKPPISVDFQIPMYSSSGVQVRFLKVYEKSSYETSKWVRYLSKAGEYQIRL